MQWNDFKEQVENEIKKNSLTSNLTNNLTNKSNTSNPDIEYIDISHGSMYSNITGKAQIKVTIKNNYLEIY